MLTTSFLLGSLSVLGFYLIFRKMSPRTRGFFTKRPVMTDLITAIVTYVIFAGSVTGLLAAAFAGIIVSVMLAARKNSVLMAKVDELGEKYKEFVSWIETAGQDKRVEDNVSNR